MSPKLNPKDRKLLIAAGFVFVLLVMSRLRVRFRRARTAGIPQQLFQRVQRS